MAQEKIPCNVCGYESEIDTNRAFFFCPECGNKMLLTKPTAQTSMAQTTGDVVAKKLEEVEFYYKHSVDKKEYERTDSDPVYYLKAQDLLIDLSKQFPEDYRVWWELCKPVDFLPVLSGLGSQNQYSINESYFSKALDNAALSKKQELIEQHDAYTESKEKIRMLAEKQALEEEQRRRQAEEEERLALVKKQEEEKQKQEDAQKAIIAEREMAFQMSGELWNRLHNRDYSDIDNTYFCFPTGNNQTIVAVFKKVSNILYLNAFRMDGNKANAVSQEQCIAICFDENGYGFKFDKFPVKIQGTTPLRVFGTREKLYVNSMPLSKDAEYIKRLSAISRKPLFAPFKVFS